MSDERRVALIVNVGEHAGPAAARRVDAVGVRLVLQAADDEDAGVFAPAEMAYRMSIAAHRDTLERMIAEPDEIIGDLRAENATLRPELGRLAPRAVRERPRIVARNRPEPVYEIVRNPHRMRLSARR